MTLESQECLVVDDSKIVRTVTDKILQNIGYVNIRQAEDGQQALDRCAELMPDLIMLDWHMPVMNGIDFLKHLRASENGSKPVVIFCTTETQFDCISDAITSGANEYVMKPFDEAIIKGKLEQLGLI